MTDLGDLRARIAAALDVSTDRCARCKACDVQVDAVMAVLTEMAEGTVTEWALAYTHRPSLGLSPRRVIQPYPDEAIAREAVTEIRRMAPEDEPALMRREIGPWKEALDG